MNVIDTLLEKFLVLRIPVYNDMRDANARLTDLIWEVK